MATSEKKRVSPAGKIRIWHCTAVFFSQVPKKCTDVDISLLYVLISGIYNKFARKINLTPVAGSNLLGGLNSRNFFVFVLNLYYVEWIHTSLNVIFRQPRFLTHFPRPCATVVPLYGTGWDRSDWDRLNRVYIFCLGAGTGR